MQVGAFPTVARRYQLFYRRTAWVSLKQAIKATRCVPELVNTSSRRESGGRAADFRPTRVFPRKIYRRVAHHLCEKTWLTDTVYDMHDHNSQTLPLTLPQATIHCLLCVNHFLDQVVSSTGLLANQPFCLTCATSYRLALME